MSKEIGVTASSSCGNGFSVRLASAIRMGRVFHANTPEHPTLLQSG
ncbi:hypothetical protein [Simplicispira suum]|jgi:hypothetical protein|nr:hypothetical protein [Simplicispira suum]